MAEICVLNLDADASVRVERTRILSDAGYRVVEASTAGDALIMLRTENAQLVLLRADLPDMPTAHACRRIKGNFATSVICVSKADAREVEAGADAYLREPLDPAVLVSTLQSVFRAKCLEQELHQSEERFRVALQNSPITVFQQDMDLRYTWIYNPARHLRDFQVIGRTDSDIFTADDAELRTTLKRRVVETGSGIRHQVSTTLGGETRYHDLTIEPLRDSSGRIAGLSGAAVDITEIKRLEEELERRSAELGRSNQALQEFAYVASHDLQEPLRTISSCVVLLADRYAGKLDKEADYFIQHAIEGANRMRDFIRDLLAYSRLSNAAGEICESDAQVAFNWAVMNLQAFAIQNDASITSDSLPTVLADQSQLVQVFQNIIGNAIKYRSEAPPVVHVSAEGKDASALFTIRDNGIGIDPAYHDRIFGVFRRLHGREYPGTGIGLAICKKIIENHKGRIWVESAKGEGATFCFTLPLAE